MSLSDRYGLAAALLLLCAGVAPGTPEIAPTLAHDLNGTNGCEHQERQTTNGTLRQGTARPYQQWINGLSETNATAKARQSLAILSDAHDAAFDDLLANISNATPAKATFFQRETVIIGTDGVSRLSVPTIGDACFDIFHAQLEGNWPKAYRQFYQLNEANALAWWSLHRTKDLHSLQVVLAQQALLQARRKGWSQGVEFLERNLKEIQGQAPNPPSDGIRR